MKRLVLSCIILLLIGIIAIWIVTWETFKPEAVKATTPTTTAETTQYPAPTRTTLLQSINAERAKAGVAPLTETRSLDAAAQMKANDMVKRHYDTHTLPGSDQMLTPEMRALDYENCQLISENLYWGRAANATTDGALNGWMHSTAHRNAILDPRYSQTGFGVAGSATVTVVEHFCIAK